MRQNASSAVGICGENEDTTIQEIDFNDQHRKPCKTDVLMLSLLHGLQSAGMTIIFTTSSRYFVDMGLDSPVWSGLMIGVVPLVGGMTTFLWQKFNEKFSYRVTFALLNLIGCLGAVLYAISGATKSPAPLVVGRILMGVASAPNVIFHFVGVTTGNVSKGHYISMIGAAGILGLGVGPVLSSVLDLISFDAHLGFEAPIIFNVLTIPAWGIAVLFLSLAVCFGLFFTDLPVSELRRFRDFAKNVNLEDPETQRDSRDKSIIIVLSILLMSIGVFSIGNGSSETRTTYIAISNATVALQLGSGFAWSWNIVEAGFYVGGIFVAFSTLVFFQAPFAAKYFPSYTDRNWLVICCVVSTISSALLYDYHFDRSGSIVVWTFGIFVFNGSLLIAKIRAMSLALKIVPNKWLGFYTTCVFFLNSVARAIGPVTATYIGDGYLDSFAYALTLSVPLLLTTILSLSVYPKLKHE
mmetsp:Transcript_18512/g.30185  ORF Transcript_18512/g.30185 Transcript_18512/m.30185 type:complete len:467 (-) Transcript_18512:107-1507(-)|eukprot:CAMPEP_0203766976 /NCGR_PEP_ID=MMETSP0099_2-20121227/732_1 /ASSEMBLY_ACC=CAM_ASM_000209 /TAXON_ID=96639 /ORGANISM=" , Strain NY0313808BC1" /LENGTH=466 /DNA_ID=CAMNT_0050663417 /DNA_START=266 /DNA_END=1666 /DNA_ORIENTATION=+